MELQEKYKPQLEEGITNSVYNELFFFLQRMKLFYIAIQWFKR